MPSPLPVAIELTAEHPVTVPTPVRVTVPAGTLPAGKELVIHEAGGPGTRAPGPA